MTFSFFTNITYYIIDVLLAVYLVYHLINDFLFFFLFFLLFINLTPDEHHAKTDGSNPKDKSRIISEDYSEDGSRSTCEDSEFQHKAWGKILIIKDCTFIAFYHICVSTL